MDSGCVPFIGKKVTSFVGNPGRCPIADFSVSPGKRHQNAALQDPVIIDDPVVFDFAQIFDKTEDLPQG